MMKWKVVKHPRASSVDRSSSTSQQEVTHPKTLYSDANNNSSSEPIAKDLAAAPKDKKQQDAPLSRQDSVVASDCITLKGLLGLSRQRSETSINKLGLVSNEPRRRSRSEARGSSCDRLTIGYHTPDIKVPETGKTRSSSPPESSGWLRGRKKERGVKKEKGKNGVSSAISKAIQRSANSESRTIVDSSDDHSAVSPTNGPHRPSGDLAYVDVNHEVSREKRDPTRVMRKKGLAPKPQITNVLFQDRKETVDSNVHTVNVEEKPKISPRPKPPRKIQNETVDRPNVANDGEKRNNLKNTNLYTKNRRSSCESNSLTTIAEVHKTPNKKSVADVDRKQKNSGKGEKSRPRSRSSSRPSSRHSTKISLDQKHESVSEDDMLDFVEDSLPYHIDTPDYSTLNSEVDTKEDVSDIKTLDVVIQQGSNESLLKSDPKTEPPETVILKIADSVNEYKSESESGSKSVKFEKIHLIDAYYRQQKEQDTSLQNNKSTSEVNKNNSGTDYEKVIKEPQLKYTSKSQKTDAEEQSRLIDRQFKHQAMTVNVVVRNPSPIGSSITSFLENQIGDSHSQFVAKKSFVITVAKQEKGFQSLCKNRKTAPVIESDSKSEHQISVTFLCSEPASDTWVDCDSMNSLRLRSLSVPPNGLDQVNANCTAKQELRSRSRERRSKEKSHKKSHKSKKKEAVFHMPQAVIDELSTVLEMRRPSVDGIAT